MCTISHTLESIAISLPLLVHCHGTKSDRCPPNRLSWNNDGLWYIRWILNILIPMTLINDYNSPQLILIKDPALQMLGNEAADNNLLGSMVHETFGCHKSVFGLKRSIVQCSFLKIFQRMCKYLLNLNVMTLFAIL